MLAKKIFVLCTLLLAAFLAGCGGGKTPKTDAVNAAPPSAPAIEQMANVTREAGLNYKWAIQGKRPHTILQTIGNGCAFLDYNQDGNLDILLVGPKLALYEGDGKGKFKDVTAETGLDALKGNFLGCATGDYDNDGFPDIYVTAYRGGVLLHNEGGKKFTNATAQSGIKPQPWGSSATFTDIDNDGKLDLYIGNYVVFGPDTKPQLCDFSGKMSSCGPRFYQPEKGVLYHNDGGGKFSEVTAKAGAAGVSGKALGVAALDFDGSGYQSVAIANDEMAGDLLLNRNGKFTSAGVSANIAYDRESAVHGGMGIDWGDYDNDGKPDLIVATFQQEPKTIYHNIGGGVFEERSIELGVAGFTRPYVAFGVKWVDIDNDGWLDLAIANGHVQDNITDVENAVYQQPPQLLHNEGGTKFTDAGAQMGASFKKKIVGRGLAIGDFDNDGKMDILIVDSEGEPILLHNQIQNSGHWLGLKLIGTKSNRDAIGAKITVTAEGRTLTRYCHTDGSYMSASDVRVHVGLGKATSADVTVKWPSGATNTYKGVSADKYATLKEGDSAAK